jgi:hypothetical protein
MSQYASTRSLDGAKATACSRSGGTLANRPLRSRPAMTSDARCRRGKRKPVDLAFGTAWAVAPNALATAGVCADPPSVAFVCELEELRVTPADYGAGADPDPESSNSTAPPSEPGLIPVPSNRTAGAGSAFGAVRTGAVCMVGAGGRGVVRGAGDAERVRATAAGCGDATVASAGAGELGRQTAAALAGVAGRVGAERLPRLARRRAVPDAPCRAVPVRRRSLRGAWATAAFLVSMPALRVQVRVDDCP